MKGTVLESHDTEGAGKLDLQLPLGLHLDKRTRTSEFQEAELSKHPPVASNRRFHQLGLPPAKHDSQASKALPLTEVCSFNSHHHTHRLALLQGLLLSGQHCCASGYTVPVNSTCPQPSFLHCGHQGERLLLDCSPSPRPFGTKSQITSPTLVSLTPSPNNHLQAARRCRETKQAAWKM